MKRFRLIYILCMVIAPFMADAKTYYDTPDIDLNRFFVEKNSTYIIQYPHTQTASIQLPENVKLDFRGGSILAPIQFNHTQLTGDVKLHGSTIQGSIRNKQFVATWLCYADGKHDDAPNINAILQVCNNILFPKGIYLLEQFHQPLYPINKPYHLGINRSHTKLVGQEGAILQTSTMAGTLCIYSKPKDIPNSLTNILIEGLTFQVSNESTDFDSYQEHCHTISFMGVNHASVKDCTFKNFWGDAICLNHYGDNENTGERTRNSNVIIENNHIDGYKHSNRNGVSVISGEHVKIKNNTFINCSHSKMPGAIDVEPNSHVYTINDILIENNQIDHCLGANGGISLVSNKRGGPLYNITIRKNRITNSSRGMEFAVELPETSGNIQVENNYVDDSTDPYIFYGHGETKNWTFKKNVFKRKTKVKFGGSIKFINLKQTNNEINKMAWIYDESKPFLVLMLIVVGILAMFFWKGNH